jgi:hypothetical protein
MKTCRGCDTQKPKECFYKHKQMADGRLNFCKECVRARVSRHRTANLGTIQEYDRARGLLPHRKADKAARAHKYAGKYEPFKKRHPKKRAAHIVVGNAVREGILVPQACERCSYGIGVQAHHEDYSKPLDVIWLCTRCHGERHREINAERRRSAA